MRWSVGIQAEGDRVVTREEVVELADAVAGSGGIATGIGTTRYGAQLIVVADSRDDAIGKGTELFAAAARKAGLPAAPIVAAEAVSEAEDAEPWDTESWDTESWGAGAGDTGAGDTGAGDTGAGDTGAREAGLR